MDHPVARVRRFIPKSNKATPVHNPITQYSNSKHNNKDKCAKPKFKLPSMLMLLWISSIVSLHEPAQDDLANVGHLGLDVRLAVLLKVFDNVLHNQLPHFGIGLGKQLGHGRGALSRRGHKRQEPTGSSPRVCGPGRPARSRSEEGWGDTRGVRPARESLAWAQRSRAWRPRHASGVHRRDRPPMRP